MMTVKELRKASGMTQQQFGDYFGIPKRTIQNWEAGVNKCPEYLLKLLEYKLEHKEAHGEWIPVSYDDAYEDIYFCSVCREESYFPDGKSKFCPNCGADMERGGEDAAD